MPGAAQAPVEPGDELKTGQPNRAVENDPLYAQALTLVQRGQWSEAEDALAELQMRYPNSVEVRRAQHDLELHLSAEGTWLERQKRRRPRRAHPRAVRVLIVVNAVLYLLLVALWLVQQLVSSLR
ncbi:MAG TPA: hypothetical protein PLJ35_20495 [Anaerolineae bacterium]|nr:hypothetical protein [Anaerolineae bacterium]HOR01202.1 hypothetical protein [Anaerolineae bacterium]HPL29344.1 hypothetical protein [Anaerolineae bacterium]